MNLVFIENTPGSGQIIVISEVFDGRVVSRRLQPGDSARIVTSRFKSIVIDEEVVAARGLVESVGHREKISAVPDGLRPSARPPRRREVGRSLTQHPRRSSASEAPVVEWGRASKTSAKTTLSE